MIRNSSLKLYFDNMFTLSHQYKYSLTELENMIPWERDTFVAMVNLWAKAEEDRIKGIQMQQEQQYRNTLSQIKSASRKR